MTQLFLLRLIENEVNGRLPRSGKPHLLLMDSGQWLDKDSWALLRLVSQRIPDLTVVVATRPLFEERLAFPLSESCRYFLESDAVERLFLSLLSPEQIAAFLCSRERIADLPEVMRIVLAGRTGGHPLYSEELISHWRNKNFVVKNGNSYEIVVEPQLLASTAPPERIQKAITSRLDNLPPLELLLLKTASTIGPNFTLAELESRYPITAERHRLAEGVAHLEQLQLIRPLSSTNNPAYTFIYGFMQEVANSLLPHRLREMLVDA